MKKRQHAFDRIYKLPVKCEMFLITIYKFHVKFHNISKSKFCNCNIVTLVRTKPSFRCILFAVYMISALAAVDSPAKCLT